VISTILGLIITLADIAPEERAFPTGTPGDLGMLLGVLAGGAAVVTAATLFIWRRSGRGMDSDAGDGSAKRQAALGSTALALGIAWVLVVALPIAVTLLIGRSREMRILGQLCVFVLCPLLAATGTALGGVALVMRSSTPRPRRWRALAGIGINVLPLLLGLFGLIALYWRGGCVFC
jgi:hypothetical protein